MTASAFFTNGASPSGSAISPLTALAPNRSIRPDWSRRRVSAETSCPARQSAATTALPMYPVPPVTKTFMEDLLEPVHEWPSAALSVGLACSRTTQYAPRARPPSALHLAIPEQAPTPQYSDTLSECAPIRSFHDTESAAIFQRGGLDGWRAAGASGAVRRWDRKGQRIDRGLAALDHDVCVTPIRPLEDVTALDIGGV